MDSVKQEISAQQKGQVVVPPTPDGHAEGHAAARSTAVPARQLDHNSSVRSAANSAHESSEASVKALYYVMQSVESRLGGGEGCEGLYGSISRTGMTKVLAALAKHCGLGNESCLVDIGAGLGRPLLHALVSPGVAAAYGVEIDRIKCDKAAAFVRQTDTALRARGAVIRMLPLPAVQCAAVEQVDAPPMRTLDPATHAYSFWEGVPVDARCAFARLFAASATLRGIAVVQRAMRGGAPEDFMEDLGFGALRLVDSFAVTMSGSGRSFRAYVFERSSLFGSGAPEAPAASSASSPLIDPRVTTIAERVALDAAEEALRVEAAAAGEAGGDAVTTEFTLRRSRRTQAAVAIALEEAVASSEAGAPSCQAHLGEKQSAADPKATAGEAAAPRDAGEGSPRRATCSSGGVGPDTAGGQAAEPRIDAEQTVAAELAAAPLAGAPPSPAGSPPRGVRKPGSPQSGRAYFSRLRRIKNAAQPSVRTALGPGSEEGARAAAKEPSAPGGRSAADAPARRGLRGKAQ